MPDGDEAKTTKQQPDSVAWPEMTAAQSPEQLESALKRVSGPGSAPVSGPGSTLIGAGPETITVNAEAGSSYCQFAEIARGGMGLIYKAFDAGFGRDVVIKTLQPRDSYAATTVMRFDLEAQLSGRLQHPGIAPVYSLGRLPDGRPYLAMKYIQGRTLAAILAGRTDPTADFAEILSIFERICQTIGYAHDRGVIHRDLKPGNIMVGEFGEVLVLDWGLAKELGSKLEPISFGEFNMSAASKAGFVLDTDSEDREGLRTLLGSVMGTPAYMAPEQARGEVDQVDRRSDVFGLGAVLCTILTGKPPFTMIEHRTTVEVAAEGNLELAFARLDACNADEELVQLAKQCLSTDRAARPADGGALAQALAHFRTQQLERLQHVELESARRFARELERSKRRRIQRILGTSIFGLLLALTIGGWYAIKSSERRRTAEAVRMSIAQQAVRSALERATTEIRDSKPEAATLALKVARDRLADAADPVLEAESLQLQQEIDALRAFDAAADLRWSTPTLNRRFTAARAAYNGAFANLNLPIGERSTPMLANQIRASHLESRVREVLDEWLQIDPTNTSLLELLTALDDDPFRTQIRQAIARDDRPKLRELLARPEAKVVPPAFAAAIVLSKSVDPRQGAEFLRPIVNQNPSNFALTLSLGAIELLAQNSDSINRAIGSLRTAVALRPTNIRPRMLLGLAYAQLQNYPAAIEHYREAMELAPDLPMNAIWLAYTYQQSGDYDRAIANYRKLLEQRLEPILAEQALDGLGDCYYAQGDYDRAEKEYLAAKALKLGEDERDVPTVYSSLGDVYEARGELTKALTYFEQLAVEYPNWYYGQYRLGLAYQMRRNFPAARDALAKATRLNRVAYPARLLLGQVERELNHFDESDRIFNELMTELPQTDSTRELAKFYTEFNQEYRKLAALSPEQRTELLANGGPYDQIMLSEFYRIRNEPIPALAAYQRLETLTRATPGGMRGFYLQAATAAAQCGTPDDAITRGKVLGWLKSEFAEWQANYAKSQPGARLNFRRNAELLLARPEFVGLQNPESLPAPERAEWQTLRAELRAFAARDDRQPIVKIP